MTTDLRVATLPISRAFNGEDLGAIIPELYPVKKALEATGLVKSSASFGFAMGEPLPEVQLFADRWQDPQSLVWLVGGWGPDEEYYIGNAACKLRALARTGFDTMSLRISHPDRFRDVVVPTDRKGDRSWGDFPYGGAMFIEMGGLFTPVAVSCYKEVEDPAPAALTGTLVVGRYLKLTGRLPS
jgi:hypothetical protein